MVCFSAPIDPTTLLSGISFFSLSSSASTAINQIIYDPVSNCAFAKPDQVLDQQSKYLLLVTDAVRDASGNKVKVDDGFKNCTKASDSYCSSLSDALNQAGKHLSGSKVVDASLFTTLSATRWLELAELFDDVTQPPVILPAGAPSTFRVSDLSSLVWTPDPGVGTPNPQAIDLTALTNVGSVTFGLYLSPNFLNVSGPAAGTISTIPTNSPFVLPVPLPGFPLGFVPVSFHLFLPASPPPPGGYPVAIYGHGLSDNQFGASTYIASTLAAQGIATLSFEITGHGFGPKGTVTATSKTGTVFTESTPGRGVQLSPASPIGATDGCIAPGAIAVRDCARQSAVDLFALTATIREIGSLLLGVNPQRIYYIGQSFGGTYGTLFEAVDPDVSVSVLSGDGGSSVDVARLALTGRPLADYYLGSINPALLNVASGMAPLQAYFHDAFNDNYVFRGMPPVTNTVNGAIAIQAAFEAADWLSMLGDPLSYAPHLKTSPLSGVPAKSTLFQFGFADLEVPNPTESAVVRAANAQSSTWFFDFNVAASIRPNLVGVGILSPGFPILPHRLLSNPTVFTVPDETPLSLADQQQAAEYLLSNGQTIPNPNNFLANTEYQGITLFEIPAVLPDRLNYFQIPP